MIEEVGPRDRLELDPLRDDVQDADESLDEFLVRVIYPVLEQRREFPDHARLRVREGSLGEMRLQEG